MKYRCIGACTGWGAQKRGCEDGPTMLLKEGVFEELRSQGIDLCEVEMLYPLWQEKHGSASVQDCLSLILELNERLSQTVLQTLQRGIKPILIGGDHSMAVGSWSGVHRFLKAPFGMIWIDAHMDLHTWETSPSKAWHGMPLAALLGEGNPRFAHPSSLRAQDVCLVGVRSYEEAEKTRAKEQSIRVIDRGEVQKYGMKASLQKAIAHVTKDCEHFGVSLDLDVLDPSIAPGVGSPELGGLFLQELLEGLSLLKEKQWIAFEIVEYNPSLDPKKETARACLHILQEIL